MGVLEGGVAADEENDVDEDLRAGAPDAGPVDFDHAGDMGRPDDGLAQIGRHAVEKVGDRFFAELQADEDDDGRDSQGGDGVGLGQPRDVEQAGQLDQEKAEDDDGRGPDVGREMKGVGFEGLAVVFFGRPGQDPGAGQIDDDRHGHDQERPQRRFDGNVLEKEPPDGLDDDPDAGDEQKGRLQHGRQVFDLAVTIGVGLIGRPAGYADGDEGHGRGDQVQGRMGRLGQDAQRAGGQADDDLHAGEKNGSNNGAFCGRAFLAGGFGGAPGGGITVVRGHRVLYSTTSRACRPDGNPCRARLKRGRGRLEKRPMGGSFSGGRIVGRAVAAEFPAAP